MRKAYLRCLAFGLVAVGPLIQTAASPAAEAIPAAERDSVFNDSKALLRKLKEEMLPALTPEERAIASRVRLQFPAYDMDIYDTKADLYGNGLPYISFPRGFLLATYAYRHAIIEQAELLHLAIQGQLGRRVTDLDLVKYDQAIEEELSTSKNDKETGEIFANFENYCTYTGFDEKTCEHVDEIISENKAYKITDRINLFVVLAHELGHIVCGHRGGVLHHIKCPPVSFPRLPHNSKGRNIYEEESEADQFAFRVARKVFSGGDLMFATTDLDVLAMAEDALAGKAEERPFSIRAVTAQGPNFVCRSWGSQVGAAQEALKDPKYVQYLENNNMLEHNKKRIEDVEVIISKADCRPPKR